MSQTKILNGVLGLAYSADGKVLLTQRHQPQHPQVHLKWQIPGGGQEYGEHLIDTLRREMQEELGLSNFNTLNDRPLVKYSLWELEGLGKTHVNLFVYLLDIGSQIPSIGDEETNAFQWFTLEEADRLDTLPGTVEFIRDGFALIAQMDTKRKESSPTLLQETSEAVRVQ